MPWNIGTVTLGLNASNSLVHKVKGIHVPARVEHKFIKAFARWSRIPYRNLFSDTGFVPPPSSKRYE